ncbi:ferrous iron transporter B, partial [Sphaeroforma arctica JP610]
NQPANARTLSVALLGGANTGKSTLMNAFLDTKLCMVSPIQQTTIQRQLGVLTKGEVQIRFYDTPGLINNRQKSAWHLPQ